MERDTLLTWSRSGTQNFDVMQNVCVHILHRHNSEVWSFVLWFCNLADKCNRIDDSIVLICKPPVAPSTSQYEIPFKEIIILCVYHCTYIHTYIHTYIMFLYTYQTQPLMKITSTLSCQLSCCWVKVQRRNMFRLSCLKHNCLYLTGACSSAVGWGTVLQAEGRVFESQWGGFFSLPNPSCRNMAPGLTRLTEKSTRNLPGRVKGGRRFVRLTILPPFVSRLSRESVGASTSHNLMGFHGLLPFREQDIKCNVRYF
jgi:hypothetical protein